MHGKLSFFINLDTTSPTYSNDEELKTIDFLKQVFNNPNAFYNMPQETAFELMIQMDVQQITGSIDAHKTSIALYEKINAQARQYFTENPSQSLIHRIAKESLNQHEVALENSVCRSELAETLKNVMGFNEHVNLCKTIIANYNDMKEILMLSSQLIEKLNQSLVLLGMVEVEKSSGIIFGM